MNEDLITTFFVTFMMLVSVQYQNSAQVCESWNKPCKAFYSEWKDIVRCYSTMTYCTGYFENS